MKKKGLIISTAVMVVVLIAALTTATFAWFSDSAAATIDGLEIGAKSATSLQIGVVANNTNTATAASDLMSGQQVTWSESQWTGGAHELGSSITFNGLDGLAELGKAVSYTTEAIGSTVKENSFFAALGDDKGSYKQDTAATAKDNVDMFKATVCVVPVREGINQMYLTVTVTSTSTETLGMAAAIHFAFEIDGQLVDLSTGKPFEGGEKFNNENAQVSAFDGHDYKSNFGMTGGAITKDEEHKGTTEKSAGAAGTWTYVLEIDKSAATAYTGNNWDGATKKFVTIYAWIEGTDESCVNETTSTGATIEFTFNGVEKAGTITDGRYTAATD